MISATCFLGLLLVFGIALTIFDSDFAFAAKTGSYNFCEVFPMFSECGGWRTSALSDNFWFCEYVDLDNFCNNPPESDRQIMPLSEKHCCRYLGQELEREHDDVPGYVLTSEQLNVLQNTNEPISPAIIWTDKDHYDFLDKVVIFGKFDFNNISIAKNLQDIDFIQTGVMSDNSTVVDIKINGRKIIRDMPLNENGWFSAFYYLDNRYHFSNQNNLLEVEYIVTSGVIPPSGPETHATYHFTTGDIAKEDDAFDMWIDDALMPNKIRYGVITDNPQRFVELDRYNLVISRLITPAGYVIPIASDFAIRDLSSEYDGFKEYGPGTYEIQITYGENTVKKSFVY